MPLRVFFGKRKNGDKREYVMPSHLHGPNGDIAWREWEIKNHYRDSMSSKLLDAHGRIVNKEQPGLVFDHKGKITNSVLIENFTREEVLKDLAKNRRSHKKLGGVDRRTKNAGTVLTQLSKLKRGEEQKAFRLLVQDPFFKVGFFTRELDIPENASLTKVYEMAQDFFFKKFKEMNVARKTEFKSSTHGIISHIKRAFH